MRRPVTVIVPFHGDAAAASAVIAALLSLERVAGDQLLVADNTPEGVVAEVAGGTEVQVVPARDQRSSYYARNVGAEHARNDWLLFLDSDCRPGEGLIDAYLAADPDDDVGAVAGEVGDPPGEDGLLVRWARTRGHLSQAENLRHSHLPLAVTANLLVRRSAWAGIGGFQERVRSGGDWDFSWRLQEAGWRIDYRPEAQVVHEHRTGLRALLRQSARYGAGRAWLNRRHPGAAAGPDTARRLVRAAAGTVGFPVIGQVDRGLLKGVDGLVTVADTAGYLMPNSPVHPDLPEAPGLGAGSPQVVVMVDAFPKLTETFVTEEAHALRRAGHSVRVEAAARAERPNRAGGRGLDVHYLEDDGVARRAAALARLFIRHPLRVAADLTARRRWAREEPVWPLRALAPPARRLAKGDRAAHLHAHFAGTSALNAMRLHRITGVPYSVTAHAYDIWQTPANLREKLERAAFATSGCRYNVEHLREVAPKARVSEIVMGIDSERFRRVRPYPGGRAVVAVGRLVEKKGFAYLVEAAAALEAREPLETVTIVGDGPLAADLRELAERLGVSHRVRLVGAREPGEVRGLLEEADLLAMPCVVAADGDRDSMPVVVKEALAMEVPVVASDEVGLPEVVRPEWGRLAPPRDSAALAAAIGEMLALAPDERAAMGRAGRAFVIEAAGVDGEAGKLWSLVEASRY
jgi:glycosyltransferase involved in cell wall biosynthesis/GT2 family glycosyltransferase